jgi:hypothetical protein
MLAQIGPDGVSRQISQLVQIDTDGITVRQLAELWQNDLNGVPRLIYSASGGRGASIFPEYAQGSRNSRIGGSVTTSTVAITLSRSSPTDLIWTFNDPGWSVASPGALSTAFRSPPLGANSDASTTATLTAVYPSSPDAVSNPVTLYAINLYQPQEL